MFTILDHARDRLQSERQGRIDLPKELVQVVSDFVECVNVSHGIKEMKNCFIHFLKDKFDWMDDNRNDVYNFFRGLVDMMKFVLDMKKKILDKNAEK